MIAPQIGLVLPSGWEVGFDTGLRVSPGARAVEARVGVHKAF
jgi:hypothetical protein